MQAKYFESYLDQAIKEYHMVAAYRHKMEDLYWWSLNRLSSTERGVIIYIKGL